MLSLEENKVSTAHKLSNAYGEMIKPKKGTFIKQELNEINEMVKEISEYTDKVENDYE